MPPKMQMSSRHLINGYCCTELSHVGCCLSGSQNPERKKTENIALNWFALIILIIPLSIVAQSGHCVEDMVVVSIFCVVSGTSPFKPDANIPLIDFSR